MNRPWLKAGLIGTGILFLLNLLSITPLPLLGCLTTILEVVAFVGMGALAAYWMAPPRLTGPAAGQGALAGLLMGVIGALIATLLAPVGFALSGGSNALISALPPETIMQLEQAGVDLNALFGGGTVAGMTAFCCLPAGAIVGAALGALGGLLYASMNPGKTPPPTPVEDWTNNLPDA